MKSIEKIGIVLERIQNEVGITPHGEPCKIYDNSFGYKLHGYEIDKILTMLEYEKVLRIMKMPTEFDGAYTLKILPNFNEYKIDADNRLKELDKDEMGGFVYSRNSLILNGEKLIQNNKNSNPDKLLKLLWENKRITRNGRTVKEGNYMSTKLLDEQSGYNDKNATMNTIGEFNKKLADSNIHNIKGTGYLLILETDSEVTTIIHE